ncbi:hypothetical protein ALC62_13642 [Cyphomyrmex costatus]|uniref:Uncharacterized protein n=1 Tax=Cyphomyrmex costatus TaxID=456900 RepID=A0A151I9M7_9HYME|nr:hypothetical protein ALC62_13642 [Cyphomyrmex costatus]
MRNGTTIEVCSHRKSYACTVVHGFQPSTRSDSFDTPLNGRTLPDIEMSSSSYVFSDILNSCSTSSFLFVVRGLNVTFSTSVTSLISSIDFFFGRNLRKVISS